MKSTDVIVFNPMRMHCCSNFRYKDSYIFSAYMYEKTVITDRVGLSNVNNNYC